ncbi:MAG: CopG family ribbon-helix-helix protein [Burkholderiales bacterium]
MATLNLRLDEALDRRLAREAELEDQTRSELARQAISAYLSQCERQRFQAEIARAARDRGSREAVTVAEEALGTSNEALAIGEGAAAEPSAQYRTRRKKH